MLTQHFTPKSATFQNNSKNDFPSGAWAPPGGTILLSKILILVNSIAYLSMVKKAKWFVDGKSLIFQNSKVENFKNLEILQSKRDFSISFWQWFLIHSREHIEIFCICSVLGTLQENKESNRHGFNSKVSSFNTKLGKDENYFVSEHFLLISLCINFLLIFFRQALCWEYHSKLNN